MSKTSKAEQAYLYIIKKMQSKATFGKTLFYKILYFSDFDFYELFEKSITGSDYRKIQNGPAPCNFDKILRSLKNKGFVQEIKPQNENSRIKYILTNEPEFDQLTSDEIKILDRDIKRLESMTATQVSEYSHLDMPYKATKEGEIINFELVFYRNPLFSVKEKN